MSSRTRLANGIRLDIGLPILFAVPVHVHWLGYDVEYCAVSLWATSGRALSLTVWVVSVVQPHFALAQAVHSSVEKYVVNLIILKKRASVPQGRVISTIRLSGQTLVKYNVWY